jgi:hypothetical protein
MTVLYDCDENSLAWPQLETETIWNLRLPPENKGIKHRSKWLLGMNGTPNQGVGKESSNVSIKSPIISGQI